jgi:succinate dehydrogenase / fumarate reductase cytochrome b subunit
MNLPLAYTHPFAKQILRREARHWQWRRVDTRATPPIVAADSPNYLKEEGFMADATPSARPVSPHLSIWRWTATMAASITHRATGVALYAGAALLAVWFVAAALAPEYYAPVRALVGSPFGLVVLFGFAWSLIFHTLNGLRHLYWDTGRGLAPKTASMTAWLTYAASLIIAAAVFAAASWAPGA